MPDEGILCQALNRHRVAEECCAGVELSVAQATQQGGGTILAQQLQGSHATHADIMGDLFGV